MKQESTSSSAFADDFRHFCKKEWKKKPGLRDERERWTPIANYCKNEFLHACIAAYLFAWYIQSMFIKKISITLHQTKVIEKKLLSHFSGVIQHFFLEQNNLLFGVYWKNLQIHKIKFVFNEKLYTFMIIIL